jgi:hypothetical protein
MKVRRILIIRVLFLVFACVVLSLLYGCIPLPEHGLLAGRGKVEEADIAFLKIGVTTREDVVLRFGEPDIILFDQRILAYSWTVSIGVFLGQYSAGDITRDQIFMLEFNEEGKLKRAAINSSGWIKKEAMLTDWIKKSENPSISGNAFR